MLVNIGCQKKKLLKNLKIWICSSLVHRTARTEFINKVPSPMGHLIHFKAMMKYLARKINYVEESLPYDGKFQSKSWWNVW